MGNDDVFLTAEGAEKLKKELEVLCGPKRLEMAARLRYAIQQGDLTENANYITKILELEDTLRRAVIIDDTLSTDTVAVGSTVIVSLSDEATQTYRVVGAKEADPRRGLISHRSPYGQALLGKRVGDIAHADTPSGSIELKVIEIR